MEIFEQASRMKIRFMYRGVITTEDLWDLPVQELDQIFREINSKIRASREESLLIPTEKPDEILATKAAILRHVVSMKLAEAEARKTEAEKKARREKILAILAEQQDAGLRQKSPEELKKLLEEL
jgi:hypothetical protein